MNEWLDMHQFESIAHAQLLTTQWLWQYNNERPNTATGGIPPPGSWRQLNMYSN